MANFFHNQMADFFFLICKWISFAILTFVLIEEMASVLKISASDYFRVEMFIVKKFMVEKFMVEKFMVEKFMVEKSGVKMFSNPLKDVKFSMAIKKKSPYKLGINMAIMRMAEIGELRKIQKKYFKTPEKCTTTVESMGFEKLLTIFIVIISAMITSLFTILIEIIVNKVTV